MGSKSSKAPEAPAKEPDDHKTLRLSYEVKELSQQTKPAHRSKIVLKGPEQSGKTSLGMRCCNNEFDPQYAATIGVDFRIARFSLNEVEHTLQIWDTVRQLPMTSRSRFEPVLSVRPRPLSRHWPQLL